MSGPYVIRYDGADCETPGPPMFLSSDGPPGLTDCATDLWWCPTRAGARRKLHSLARSEHRSEATRLPARVSTLHNALLWVKASGQVGGYLTQRGSAARPCEAHARGSVYDVEARGACPDCESHRREARALAHLRNVVRKARAS